MCESCGVNVIEEREDARILDALKRRQVERHDWVLCLTLNHKYYLDRNSGKIGVADESSELPEDTADGLFYLDESRPITCNEFGEQWMIPLRRTWNGDDDTQTPASWQEVVALTLVFHGRLAVHDSISKDIDILKSIGSLNPLVDD